jgi:hypothetical protein
MVGLVEGGRYGRDVSASEVEMLRRRVTQLENIVAALVQEREQPIPYELTDAGRAVVEGVK